MKDIQKILSRVRRASEKYSMIRHGDLVAVGLSGGKDSIVLLKALAALRKFDAFSFELKAFTVDPAFEKIKGGAALNTKALSDFCSSLGVEHHVIKTQIAEIVFEERRETSPCSLCAHMRRGALSEAAAAAGCASLALGHNMDDAVETYIMNIFRGGRAGCFSPVTEYNDKSIRIIRPLVYLREFEIASYARRALLPVAEKSCPMDGNTERQHIRELLRGEDKRERGLHRRILGAIERSEIDGWKE